MANFLERQWWYPRNVDWKEFNRQGHALPEFSDLLPALWLAVVLTVIRKVLNVVLFLPLARTFIPSAYAKSRLELPALHPDLEPAFFQQQKPPKQRISSLAKSTGLSDSEVSSWFAKRREKWRGQVQVGKWTDSCWQSLYYTLATVYGFWLLWDKPWFHETKQCWTGYPYQPATADVKWYYLVSLAVYIHFGMALLLDTSVRYKDFWEMLIHHCATILLIAFSYMVNFVRIGTLVILVHDISDPFRELAKVTHYAKYQRLCDVLFTLFAVVFGVTRLYVYPFYVVYSASVESHDAFGMFPAFNFFNGLLILLQILHIYWMYLIARMVYSFVVKGTVEKDGRSATEDSEADGRVSSHTKDD